MLRSKAVKESLSCNYNNSNAKHPIRRILSGLIFSLKVLKNRIKWFIKRVKKSLDWAVFAWEDYDFDSSYLFSVMSFKLKRMQKILTNGHLIQDEEDLIALQEAIDICDRLDKREYDEKYLNEHDKKWGETDHISTPNFDKNGKIVTYTWDSFRKHAVTNKQKGQERKEFLECINNGDLDEGKDFDKLLAILKKHSRSWWD